MSNDSNFELPQEFLELVSGGKMNEEEREKTIIFVKGFKASGTSKEAVTGRLKAFASWRDVDKMSPSSECSIDECVAFIEEIWDTV